MRTNANGGVDVAGARFIAQVKHYGGSVGVAPIRELTGVAICSAERAELLGMDGLAKTLMVRGLG
jgi:hypothetical protein